MGLGRGLTVCCLVAATFAGPLDAQEPALPSVGTRVRVHSRLLTQGPLVGTLTAIDQRSLSVRRGADGESRALALADISRLEKSVHPGRKRKGALVGLGVGFAVGFLGTALLGGTSSSAGDSDSLLVWGSIWGAAVAPAGAAIGAAVAPGERWAEASISRIPPGDAHARPTVHSRFTIHPVVGRRCGFVLQTSF